MRIKALALAIALSVTGGDALAQSTARQTGLNAAADRGHVRLAQAGAPRPARDVTTFRDSLRDGSPCVFCPEMVVVRGGRFRMGSPRTERGREADEGPLLQVRVSTFAVGRFELTQAQWNACVADAACASTPAQADNMPVAHVSWDDAQTYLAWLSRQTGRRYRLLSEAEWEYAARARSRATWPWGADPAAACRFANIWDRGRGAEAAPCTDGLDGVAPVGSLRANAFGLHDMNGNVWEWVQDCYASYSRYSTRTRGRDSNVVVADPVERPNCTDRVDRGGAWDGDPWDVRSAQRSRHTPTLRANLLGFRVARDTE
jgi:formylglycine-generating enzyme required for sulfatase activity